MLNDKLRQILVVFSVVALIVMNYLSNVRAFGGRTNAEVSDKYHTFITPAGYAFSIWGLIFLGLLAFAIYQALPSQRYNPRFRTIGGWVILNAFLNAIWSPLFNNEWIGIAVLVILTMLFSLVKIIDGLQINRKPVDAAETWLARVPFSIYFGWLTVATILNVAVYLKATEFSLSGLTESGWAAGILVVGILIGGYLFNRYRDVAYILVFAWAYIAIAVEQQQYTNVKIFAIAGAAGAVLMAIAGLLSRKTPAYT